MESFSALLCLLRPPLEMLVIRPLHLQKFLSPHSRYASQGTPSTSARRIMVTRGGLVIVFALAAVNALPGHSCCSSAAANCYSKCDGCAPCANCLGPQALMPWCWLCAFCAGCAAGCSGYLGCYDWMGSNTCTMPTPSAGCNADVCVENGGHDTDCCAGM